jgi:hypothetical protein
LYTKSTISLLSKLIAANPIKKNTLWLTLHLGKPEDVIVLIPA